MNNMNNYLQMTLCFLVAVSSVRLMPIEETTTTESTDTTENTETTWPAIESTTPEILLASSTEMEVASTTEEKSNPAIDQEDPSVWSSSQTVEIRLHPQFLRMEEPKLVATTMATNEEDSKSFGRRMENAPQQQQQEQQQQDESFNAPTGRLRTKDSFGAALRRAVTGSPVLQKLQRSASRMSNLSRNPAGRAKAGEATPRKIVGFASLSNLPARLPSNIPLRKENFLKNRPTGHGGETPANTHIDLLSPPWLFNPNKDTGKSVDPFRLSSSERTLVLELRDKIFSTTTVVASDQENAESTTTTVSPSTDKIETANRAETEGVNQSETITTRPIIINEPSLSDHVEEADFQRPVDSNQGKPELNSATPNVGLDDSATEIPQVSVISVSPSRTESHLFGASKTVIPAKQIPLNVASETIMELDKSPLDGQSSSKQEFGSLTAGDDCNNGGDCPSDQHEVGLNMGQLGDSELDGDAHKYQVEEKTHDGYIIGEFGVISRSSDGFRGVRYIAHKSIDKQLIQDMLQTFLSLK